MGSKVEITRLDHTASELRAVAAKCVDGAQVAMLVSSVGLLTMRAGVLFGARSAARMIMPRRRIAWHAQGGASKVGGL